MSESLSAADVAAVSRQLGRVPRGAVGIAARCVCGCPLVVRTKPRLPDGTPFPTLFYATCPRLTGAISTLEGSGVMKEFSERLAADESLALAYAAAHEDYLRRRSALGEVPEIAQVSAGGMPSRVKCLHVLAAHSLAAGPGVNPLGDEVLSLLPEWWHNGCCGAGHADIAEPVEDTVGADTAGDGRAEAGLDGSRVAAVDCGTNSIRLLITEQNDAASGEVHRDSRIVRLGQGVDATGELHPAALTRTLDAANDYAQACATAGVRQVRFVATSAARDARNAAEFSRGVHDTFAAYGLDVDVEVVSGDEEAQLSFAGAVRKQVDLPAGEVVLVDLGGGSTEFVRGVSGAGTESGRVLASRSIDAGSVRLTDRYLRSDPPTSSEYAALVADAGALIDDALEQVPLAGASAIVGVAGSATTAMAHALGLSVYDSTAINGASLPVSQVVESCGAIMGSTAEQLRQMGFIHPGRVEVIQAGVALWREVLLRAQREGITRVITSEYDILDGIAASISGDRSGYSQ